MDDKETPVNPEIPKGEHQLFVCIYLITAQVGVHKKLYSDLTYIDFKNELLIHQLHM